MEMKAWTLEVVQNKGPSLISFKQVFSTNNFATSWTSTKPFTKKLKVLSQLVKL
jgi:hypothetical protein